MPNRLPQSKLFLLLLLLLLMFVGVGLSSQALWSRTSFRSHRDLEPQASADLIYDVRDTDCVPDLPIQAIGSSGGGGVAATLQSELCPPTSFNVQMGPTLPRGPCPESLPSLNTHSKAKDDIPAGSAGPVGWLAQPGGSFPSLRDGDPAALDSASYGGNSFRRARSLDSSFVDARSGELSRVEVDLFLPGAGLDFALTRFYHSELAHYRSQYGAGWESSIHRRVKVTYTGQSTVPASLQLVTGGGHPTGAFTDGNSDSWYENSDRRDIFQFADPTSGNDQLIRHEPSGLIETYERLSTSEEWFYLVKAENLFCAV